MGRLCSDLQRHGVESAQSALPVPTGGIIRSSVII
jgi:hypothetical protein